MCSNSVVDWARREGGEDEVRPIKSVLNPDEYKGAYLRLAFSVMDGDFELVFGLVELYPAAVKVPPTTEQVHRQAKVDGETVRLFARNLHIPVDEAIRWYRLLDDGKLALYPADGGTDFVFESESTQEIEELWQEPVYPNLVVPFDHNPGMFRHSHVKRPPFCSKKWGAPRIHHLVSPPNARKLYSHECLQEVAKSLVREALHIDLDDWPEMWGSAHLIAPSPHFRAVSVAADEQPADGEEHVDVTIQAWPGRRLEALTCLVTETRSTGEAGLQVVPVAANRRLKFSVSKPVELVTVWITHEDDGLQYRSGPFPFMKQISVNMNLVHGTREVTGPGGTYETPMYKSEEMWVGNKRTRSDGRDVLQRGHRQRQIRQKTLRSRTQRWFSNDREEAREELRELCAEASSKLLFVDPYFGAGELYDFALAVSDVDVEVKILTSADFLRYPLNDEVRDLENGLYEEGDRLHAELTDLRNSNQVNDLTVRVMQGSTSPIHDRLLQVDGEVWLLGSSLNSFGEYGTLLVKLPEPESVKDILETIFADSEAGSSGGIRTDEFESWYQTRCEEREVEEKE